MCLVIYFPYPGKRIVRTLNNHKANVYPLRMKTNHWASIFCCTKWRFCVPELVHALVSWTYDRIKMSHSTLSNPGIFTKKEGVAIPGTESIVL